MGTETHSKTPDGTGPDPQKKWPRIGVGLFLLNQEGRFLLLRRAGAHGAGTWGLVGGKVEFGKSAQETAVEETSEEVGVELDPAEIALGPYTSNVFPEEGIHFYTLFTSARLPQGQVPRILEPDKCTEFGWYGFDDLPSPLFAPVASFLELGMRPPFGI